MNSLEIISLLLGITIIGLYFGLMELFFGGFVEYVGGYFNAFLLIVSSGSLIGKIIENKLEEYM